jgi:Uracil DNA glycosylase superfamily
VADPLLEYVRKLSVETGREMPTPNPHGPLSRARALFVLRDPGATPESGANETGVTDPFVNSDPTSARQRTALREANIDARRCVWWNAVPYHLGYKGQLRPSDVSAGARYLRGFIECFADLRVIVAMGEGAHDVARRLSSGEDNKLPPVVYAPHPMIYGRGAKERTGELRQRLKDVARLLAPGARRL